HAYVFKFLSQPDTVPYSSVGHLLHLCDQIPQLYRVAFIDIKLSNLPAFWGPDFVLHFHCFHDNNPLMGIDLVALTPKPSNNLSRHWCSNCRRAGGIGPLPA